MLCKVILCPIHTNGKPDATKKLGCEKCALTDTMLLRTSEKVLIESM